MVVSVCLPRARGTASTERSVSAMAPNNVGVQVIGTANFFLDHGSAPVVLMQYALPYVAPTADV